ncbi:long-chain-fatty-acid--CoA ligase [Gammaproteobacteria bacterium]|nr:long-chain-fatty-acid--CoA ligase [Gammaproteobacteria bacterium]
MQIPENKTIQELFEWRFERTPKAVAHKFLDRETSYEELNVYSNQIANGLISLGCKPDSRIAYYGKNSDYFFEFLIGTLKSNTVAVGVNWRLAPPEVSYVLNDSKSEVLFVGEEFYPIIDLILEGLPNVKKVIAVDGNHSDYEDFISWRDSQDSLSTGLKSSDQDDILQLYTSGTTGHPKGVQLTNRNFAAANESINGIVPFEEGTTNLVCMPGYHVAGTNWGIWGYIFGCRNIIIADIDPGLILELIEQEKIRSTLFVPAVILFLISHPNALTTDFSSLNFVLYGASPIADDTIIKAKEIMQCDLYQVYGLTETTGAITIMMPEDHDPKKGKLRSCGKALKGVELKVVDENGNDLKIGEIGEVISKSDLNMKGYWNKPNATNESIIDGWFYSGDAGFFDDEGYLFIHDRVKDMIVSGGENIYPAEVENALMSHDEILDAAVVGVPDEKWGESVKGFVVIGESSSLSEDEITSYARTQIAAYKCPKSIEFIKELPRNPSGKILRRELRDPYWEGIDRKVSGN